MDSGDSQDSDGMDQSSAMIHDTSIIRAKLGGGGSLCGALEAVAGGGGAGTSAACKKWQGALKANLSNSPVLKSHIVHAIRVFSKI